MGKKSGKVDRMRELREAQAKEVEASPFQRHSAEVRDAIQRGRAAFEDLGAALRACKESGSWREKYTSWTEACETEWGISRVHAHRLIRGVNFMAEMREKGVPPDRLPDNLSQVRGLIGDRRPQAQSPQPVEKCGDLYVVASHCGEYVKVGRSADVSVRVAALQSGHPGELELVALASRAGWLEGAVHSALAEWRASGEWFRASGPVQAFLDRVARSRARSRDVLSGLIAVVEAEGWGHE